MRIALLIFFGVASISLTQPGLTAQGSYVLEIPGAQSHVYKSINGHDLKLHLFLPGPTEDAMAHPPYSAVVFFFGGGWRQGTPTQFQPQAEYLANRGMVVALADYRVSSRHQTGPREAVQDAKSAIRWLRMNAGRFHIDRARIAAGGGSAGGHLAAATGLVPGVEAEGEDLLVSSEPNALLLFNPVTDMTFVPSSRVANAHQISPQHFVRPGNPPGILFHGTGDTVVPFSMVAQFEKTMADNGNLLQLEAYEGRGHGFFNYGRGEKKLAQPGGDDYNSTLLKVDEFLVELGWLKGIDL